MDWNEIRERQLAESAHGGGPAGMPLLVEDVRMNLKRMRDGGMSVEDALYPFLGGSRPGALRDDEAIALASEVYSPS